LPVQAKVPDLDKDSRSPLFVGEGCSQAVGKPKKALLVTTQRWQCRHLQGDARNKANECLTKNWDSALGLKKAPRTKEQDKKKEKQKKAHKHERRTELSKLFKPVKLWNDSPRS
jgi:hypothetical protein